MDYTLHQLQVYLKITQTKSITKAAVDLHLTQPAVSIQLRNFQDQFDIPLTEVVGRKLYITDFGMEIAQAAQNIINEVQQINYKTAAYKGQLFGRLKIATVSTGKYVIPYFLSQFINANPGVELILDVTNKALVIDALKKNEVDFGLVSVMPDSLQLHAETLMQNRLYLVGNRNFELPSEPANYTIFQELPIIFREEGSGTRFVMEQFWNQNKIKVTKKIELASNEAVKQAVIAGLGFAIMPLIGIKNELKNGDLKIIPVADFSLCSNWNMVWQTQKNHSPVALAFLNYLKANKQQIIAASFNWTHNY
uniref:LysR family transcriptional regulator n=1 Tax=Flavobacterium sp. TaxID=239 RepID=UPI00404A2934